MTPDEIAELWVRIGEVARARGQLMHFHLEQHANGREIERPHSPEFEQLKRLLDAAREQFEILRTELSVFHRGMGLAGQIDLLCRDEDDQLVVVDYKRSREINFESPRPMQPPLEHLPDCSWVKYCLQLNLYAMMLESPAYRFVVSRMFLAVAHPLTPRARLLEVPRMPEEIRALVEHATLAMP